MSRFLLLALLLSGCPRNASEVAATVTERDIIRACSSLCGDGMIKTYKPTCLCESPEETARIRDKTDEERLSRIFEVAQSAYLATRPVTAAATLDELLRTIHRILLRTLANYETLRGWTPGLRNETIDREIRFVDGAIGLIVSALAATPRPSTERP